MKHEALTNLLLLAILLICVYGFFFKSGNGRYQYNPNNANIALDTKAGKLCATVEGQTYLPKCGDY